MTYIWHQYCITKGNSLRPFLFKLYSLESHGNGDWRNAVDPELWKYIHTPIQIHLVFSCLDPSSSNRISLHTWAAAFTVILFSIHSVQHTFSNALLSIIHARRVRSWKCAILSVFIHTYKYTYWHTYKQTYIHTDMKTHTYKQRYIRTCTQTSVLCIHIEYVCIYVSACVYVCIYICNYV